VTHELRRLLVARGADRLPHAGGSLLEHLGRTSERLAGWGGDSDVRTLALAHACYGTDGFGEVLLTLDERDVLRDAVGAAVEAEVYRYASCGRDRTYPHLADRPRVLFHDRFTGAESLVDASELRRFAELTVANELDVYLHLDDPGEDFRTWLLDLVDRMRDLLTDAAVADCTESLRPAPTA